MKKTTFILLAAVAMVACGNSYDAKTPVLTNSNDSVNYALGLVNGGQIRMQHLSDADEKAAQTAVNEFIDALQRGWDGKVEDMTEAATVGRNIGSAVKMAEEKGLANNPAWTINQKMFFQGLVNGVYRDTVVMEADDARFFFQQAYQNTPAEGEEKTGKVVKAKCGDKVKAVELKDFSDSINYAFGLLNGNEIALYVLLNDSDGSQHKEFFKSVNKALSSGAKYPQLIQMGEQIGKTIKEQSAQGLIGEEALTTDFELIKQGFINGMLEFGDWEAMTAGQYIQEVIDNIRYGNVKAEGEAFLEANKLRDGVITTESGLQYEVLKEGKGKKPSATDRVRVHYHGTLIDGTVFDSSVDRGEPITFGLNQVIKGWTEGVQLMSVGSKYKFYIPQELGYGGRQAGSIPPYSALIFEVELLGIE